MANYFADETNGLDTNTGLSHAQAWKTLNKAHTYGQANGDKVYFLSGETWDLTAGRPQLKFRNTNVEFLSYYMSGGSEVLDAVSGNKPKLDGLDTYPNNAYEGIVETKGTYSISGCVIRNIQLVNSAGAGFRGVENDNMTVDKCYAYNCVQAGFTHDKGTTVNFTDNEEELIATGGGTVANISYFQVNGGSMSGNISSYGNGESFVLGKKTNGVTCENNYGFANKDAMYYFGAGYSNTIRNNIAVGESTTSTTYPTRSAMPWRGPAFTCIVEGIRPAGSSASDNLIYNNLAANCKKSFRLANARPSDSFVDRNLFYHNTSVDCDVALQIGGGTASLIWSTTATGNEYRNNIFQQYTSGLTPYSDHPSPAGVTFSNNHFSGSVVGDPPEDASNTTGDALLSKSSGWQGALTTSDIVSGDFSILSGSPCIGAGLYNSSYATDYDSVLRTSGNTDIGAFQYVASGAPAAPVITGATAGDTQNTVVWNNSPGATSHNIYWSTTSPVTTADTKIAGATTPHDHTGLTNGTTYYYAVTGENGSGESGLSSEVSATPAAATTLSGIVVDEFTDTDGVLVSAHTPGTDTVGSGWVAYTAGSGSILSNQANLTVDNGGDRIDTGVVNQVIECDVNANGADNKTSIIARSDNNELASATCYEARISPINNDLRIRKRVSGTKVVLATVSLTMDVATTYAIKFEASGTRLILTVDGVEKINITDSEITTGTYAGYASVNWTTPGGLVNNFVVNKGLEGVLTDSCTDTDNVDISAHTPDQDDVGTGWNDSGANQVEILSNRMQPKAASQGVWADIGVSDQVIKVTANANSTNSRLIIKGRRSSGAFGAETAYWAVILFDTDTINIDWASGGVYQANLGTSAFTFSLTQTYDIELSIIGDALILKIDGVAKISITDTNITSGTYVGIESGSTWATPGFWVDDIELQDGTPTTSTNSSRGINRGIERGIYQ